LGNEIDMKQFSYAELFLEHVHCLNYSRLPAFFIAELVVVLDIDN
jgi:hypothetical protein